jgi:NodT family efflux transporter outer membrane factor (OMF) lipoprotein
MFRSIVFASFIFLTGCATKLEQAPEQQEILSQALPETTSIPAAWVAPPGDTGAVDDGWIKSFNDPQLEALVAEGLDVQKPNMRLLSAQVDRAEAMARLGNAALQPTVAMGGNLSETGGSSAASGTSSSIGVGVSWEADIWGRVQAGASAADENYRASIADFEFARQSLAASIAKSWYLATELHLQEQLAREVVDISAETNRITEAKQKIGQVTMQDVYLSRAEYNTAEDALRQAIGGQQQAQRALEIWLSRYPAAEIQTAKELVPVPPQVPAGLPVDLLERRPDLLASERRVASAFYLAEEARLAKLPSFSLNASVGSSNSLNDLVGNLGAGFVAPLFTGGALEAQLDAANADQESALASYALVVLNALEEVETSLSQERLLTDRERFLAAATTNNESAWRLANKRYAVGEIDLLSVLQMQSRWIGARIALLHVRNERLAQRIDLHLALGGSFEQTDGE